MPKPTYVTVYFCATVVGRSVIRISENETVELQDWHPAPSAHMDSANDDNIAGLDAAFPDAPLGVGRLGIWSASL
jgi:hypothetical protein